MRKGECENTDATNEYERQVYALESAPETDDADTLELINQKHKELLLDKSWRSEALFEGSELSPEKERELFLQLLEDDDVISIKQYCFDSQEKELRAKAVRMVAKKGEYQHIDVEKLFELANQ